MRSSQSKYPLKFIVMGLLSMVAIPAAIVLLAEFSLRLTGAGHPTRFFLQAEDKSSDILTTNHRFTHRFFPPALARGMIPYRISREKPDATFRIFIFGESAANGDPEPAYSFGRHLELLLETRYPETNFEVICTAITAINSHVILPIAEECAEIESDLWLIYMGNNEVIGPYGAGTIFGTQAPPLPVVRANLALQTTRIGQLIERGLAAIASGQTDLENWEGINMFAQNTLAYDDPARLRVLESFERNLSDILDLAGNAGVPVLLSTVASNLRDSGPFASLQGRPLDKDETVTWNGAIDEGRTHLTRNNYPQARAAFEQAAAIDPLFAELQFLLGQTHLGLGNLDMAKAAFTAARDYDALSVRADSRINQAIRRAADSRAASGVSLVDMEAILGQIAADGIPGRESFFEHVHFTPDANDRIARALTQHIEPLLPENVRRSDTGSWASAGNIRARLALTLSDQQRIWSEMAQRLATPPYNNRVNADAAVDLSQQQAAWLGSRVNANLDRQIYEMALAADPDNYHLLTRFGYFLLAQQDFDGAIAAFTMVRDQFPHFEGGHQDLGLALFLADRRDEARDSFERVLKIRPGYPRALKALELLSGS